MKKLKNSPAVVVGIVVIVLAVELVVAVVVVAAAVVVAGPIDFQPGLQSTW